MQTPIAGRLYVFAALRGDYDLVLRVANAARAWRFRNGSTAFRFLTEELSLQSATAAQVLRMSTQPPLSIRLTTEQWNRLRRTPSPGVLPQSSTPVNTRPGVCMDHPLEQHLAAR